MLKLCKNVINVNRMILCNEKLCEHVKVIVIKTYDIWKCYKRIYMQCKHDETTCRK